MREDKRDKITQIAQDFLVVILVVGQSFKGASMAVVGEVARG